MGDVVPRHLLCLQFTSISHCLRHIRGVQQAQDGAGQFLGQFILGQQQAGNAILHRVFHAAAARADHRQACRAGFKVGQPKAFKVVIMVDGRQGENLGARQGFGQRLAAENASKRDGILQAKRADGGLHLFQVGLLAQAARHDEVGGGLLLAHHSQRLHQLQRAFARLDAACRHDQPLSFGIFG